MVLPKRKRSWDRIFAFSILKRLLKPSTSAVRMAESLRVRSVVFMGSPLEKVYYGDEMKKAELP